jgi:hypothetical protein
MLGSYFASDLALAWVKKDKILISDYSLIVNTKGMNRRLFPIICEQGFSLLYSVTEPRTLFYSFGTDIYMLQRTKFSNSLSAHKTGVHHHSTAMFQWMCM